MPRPSNFIGALLGLAAMGAFACGDAAIKFLGLGYSPFQIIFVSGSMTLVLIAALAAAGPPKAGLRPANPRLMALRSCVVLFNSIFVTSAFTLLPLAQCYAIMFTMPMFIVLLAVPFLGEKIDAVRGVAVVVGLIGVIIALDPGAATLQWGHAAALAGAFLGAINTVMIRKTGGQERAVVMVMYPLLVQVAVTAVFMPFVFVPMPSAHIGIMAFLAVAAFLGYLLIIAAYRRAPGIVVAPMQYSQIIWAAGLGAVLFDETMGTRMIAGMVLIIAAGIAIIARQDKLA